MRRKITLVALSVFGLTLSANAQQSTAAHHERSVCEQPNVKPIQHVQPKMSTAIWGANASVGVADGQFQNAFVQSTSTSSYNASYWSAVTISESSGATTPGNAYWTQTISGVSQGAYFGTAPTLQSPTQANGAAIFDSDFMDNGGVAGAFGTGSSPTAHEGWLVSPRIDLTGYTDSVIAIRFWLKWREYIINDLTMSFSTDDGVTWSEQSIKGDLPSGGNDVEGWVTKYITNECLGVANLTQCRIRFRFHGDYYYAMIDDVNIETAAATDLTIAPNDITSGFISDQMYQLQVMNNRHMPISGISDPRDFSYGVVIQNEGGGTNWHSGPGWDGFQTYVQRDNGGVWTTVYSDTIDLPSIAYDANEIVTDTIADISWATVGDYRMLYVLDHWQDLNSSNDTLIEYFSINDDTYASKVQRDGNGLPVMEAPVFPTGSQSTFEFGSTFEFSGMGTSNKRVDSISQGFYVPANYIGPANVNYTVRFYEWNDGNGNQSIDDISELTLVAIGADTLVGVLSGVGTYIMQSTQLIDVNTMMNGYAMQDNKTYVATVSLIASENGQATFDASSMVWVACASSVNYAMNFFYTNEKPSFLHLIDGGGAESLIDQGFGFSRIPAMGLHISTNCDAVVSNYNFTENYLEVSFSDLSNAPNDVVVSWSWDFGDGNTSTDQNPTHTYTAPGQYEVCLTVMNSCGSTATFCDSVTVEQNTSGLVDNWADALVIYPNPAEDVVRIQNLPQGSLDIELRNVVGQVIYETAVDDEFGVEVPVTQLAAGHYNLIVRSNAGVVTKHVVVK